MSRVVYDPRVENAAVERARLLLQLRRDGTPVCQDSSLVVAALAGLLRTRNQDAIQEIGGAFLRDSATRYAERVEPDMVWLNDARFIIGSDPDRAAHFCGESPAHPVELPGYAVQRVPVTNELFALLDPGRAEMPAGDRGKPVVNVTWFDAVLFAVWVGCRLPTEAEWEFACGAGSDGQWCSPESELGQFAWFSENAEGELRPAGTRLPNSLGIHDMHGNVWEWCQDVYDQDYYGRSRLRSPVHREGGPSDRVCRGGSFISFAEMCRTRYRFHEPPWFHAADLGFRLARSADAANLEEAIDD